MCFGHEKLDVYRLSLDYISWVFKKSGELTGKHRHSRDQWLRASQSVPLNIAEGNGKSTDADRRRYFEIARGSALECAAIQDVLEVCNGLKPEENRKSKELLNRIVAMLTGLGGRKYSAKETSADYESDDYNIGSNSDCDIDKNID